MKIFKKLLCALLVVVMCMTSAPINGFVGLEFKAKAVDYEVGDIIEFGSYPQSEVEDESLIAELNALAPSWDDWTSYGYYSGNGNIGSQISGDWMRYIDIAYNGKKYRGVKFTEYRPGYTVKSTGSNNSFQDENGYHVNTIYWFKWEPICWIILDKATGLVVSKSILDARCYTDKYYTNDGRNVYLDEQHTFYSNNYANCHIRKWLGNDFLSASFSDSEQTKIKNIEISNNAYNYRYTCENTSDKVFLLSWEDVTNNSYGFSTSTNADETRKVEGSDYAKSQGLRMDNDQPWWWLRTAGEYSYGATFVIKTALSNYADVCISSVGVRPAMVLNDIKNIGSSDSNDDTTNTPDDPKSDGYKLKLWSDGAYSDSIAVGESIGFDVYLLENGKYLDCEKPYAVSFDVQGVFEVSQIKTSSDSMYIKLRANKAGTTNMTISDNVTGAYVTIKLKANNAKEVLTMDEVEGLAKEHDGIKTHFYDYNGLYVNNFYYREKSNGSYEVSMNVYNEKAHYGAVVSYDKNGNIHKCQVIEPQDKLPESILDGIFDLFDRVNYELEVFGDKAYTNNIRSKWTKIECLEVPKDGYLIISNNAYSNDYVTFVNLIDIAIDVYFAKKGIKDLVDPDAKKKVIEMTVLEIVSEIGMDGFKSLFNSIFKNTVKEITIDNIDIIIDNLINRLDEFNVDFEKVLKKSIDTEFWLNFGEDVTLFLLGGEKIKKVLQVAGYSNTALKLYDMGSSTLSSEICIYTPPAEEKVRISNGVTVTSEKPLDPKYVLHTYVINQNDDLMTDAVPTIDPLADNYNMYDITLYKSGEAVQPDAKIKVMIPIPAGYDKSRISVYWYKEDGTLEKMNAIVNGSYAIFETDHLSCYVLVEEHVHIYGEDEAICTDYGFDRTESCNHNCHKTGIAGFFWKIINFFNKIFKIKQYCDCGVSHY